MKTFVSLVAVCATAYLIFDFPKLQQTANEVLRDGTLQGVEVCVANSESALVTVETTRNACSARFQKNLYSIEFATGRAGPSVQAGKVLLEGSLENKKTSHVTTWIALSFYTFDADGKKSEFVTDTFLWIEPSSATELSVTLPDLEPEQVRDMKFCDHEDESPKSCMGWGVMEIRGIEI
ncbi:hypothetical protein Q8W25_01075 [Shimia thalassica]|uniref:hypothetical protein n=1 Tax=Shimia thalassica TaxID=1715693 RepID=UPI0027353F1C|nr:hypothetical protein [Shimia thalassica]MDP2492580.1 hypothetical protein [Shimia thalassica]